MIAPFARRATGCYSRGTRSEGRQINLAVVTQVTDPCDARVPPPLCRHRQPVVLPTSPRPGRGFDEAAYLIYSLDPGVGGFFLVTSATAVPTPALSRCLLFV